MRGQMPMQMKYLTVHMQSGGLCGDGDVAHCETKAFSEVRVAATVDVFLVVDLGMCPWVCATSPTQPICLSLFLCTFSELFRCPARLPIKLATRYALRIVICDLGSLLLTGTRAL